MKTKKLFIYLPLLLALMFGAVGCSSKDDEVEKNNEISTEDAHAIVGKWEMESCNYDKVMPGESLFDFHKDGTVSVVSKSKFMNDTYLLPTGDYHYSIAEDSIRIEGNWINYKYYVEGNELHLSFDSQIHQDNAFVMSLLYIFHRK